MDATETAAAIREAEGYEEGITQRTAALTNMVWGLAAPLIFLTYGAAANLVEGGSAPWLMYLLWIPGVALGSLLTTNLWASHAVSLRQQPNAKAGWRHLGINTAIFLVMALIIGFGLGRSALDWNTSVAMVLVNGLFAFLVARREAGASLACSRHTSVAAAFMVVGAFVLGVAGLGEPASSLGGAAITSIGWAGSGLWTYLRS